MQGHPGRGDDGSAVSNFVCLTGHYPVFVELAARAERAFGHDPNTTLIKLRQLAEAMAQDIAARLGIELHERASQREWRRRRRDMSTSSTCRHGMFKKPDYFDTSSEEGPILRTT